MKAKRINDRFSPCLEARNWMETQKNTTEAWKNCERGDWMLWIAKKLNREELDAAAYDAAAAAYDAAYMMLMMLLMMLLGAIL